MISWGTRKKFIYLGVVFAAFVIGLAAFTASVFYDPPSCADGKLNQGELGVDCGGPCIRLCESQTIAPVVHWQRVFPVVSGVYNAVAYVENLNRNSGVRSAEYEFKIYDRDNILIAERVGTAFIPPRRVMPIFEANIKTGDRRPARVVFNFRDTLDWILLNQEIPELNISEQVLKDSATAPLITARITNESAAPINEFDAVVIVYDSDNNARAASKTLVDSLRPNQSSFINFAWPSPLGFNPLRIEIVPEIFPGIHY